MSEPIGPYLPVLVDDDVWPEFQPAVRGFGERWTAPSGRVYALDLAGRRLVVSLVQGTVAPPPSGEALDADLFELACRVQDAAPGEWSSAGLRRITAFWSGA